MAKFKLAYVEIKYLDNGEEHEYLCAIGEYDENDEECQEIDESVFYWFESMQELEEFKSFNENAEFVVLNYSIKGEEV
jgi:hypothetical protein